MKAIAILGSGPAGIAATWAAALKGHMTVLISDTAEPSRIGGAQFLHRPLPTVGKQELPPPDFHIQYLQWGSMEVYRNKVYPAMTPPVESSWDRVVQHEPVPAWSLRGRYNELFHLLTSDGERINRMTIDAEKLGELLKDNSFVRVISTIPRNRLCYRGCTFRGVGVSLSQGRYYEVPPNTVIYNGEPEYSWARASHIDGQEWTEWGNKVERIPVDEESLVRITKPVSHSCTCWDDEPKLIFAGRYGTWSKGKLVDDAFYDVAAQL